MPGMANLAGNDVVAPRGAPIPPSQQLSARAMKKRNKKKNNGLKAADPATTVTVGFDVSTASSPIMKPSEFSSQSTTPLLGARNFSALGGRSSSPATRESSLSRAISELRLNSSSHEGFNPRNELQSPGSERSDIPPSSPLAACAARPDDSDRLGSLTSAIGGVPMDRTASNNIRNPRNKPLIGAIEGGLRRDSPHRKMTATDFEPLKCLGKGTFGTVLLVKQHSTGRLFAQKQLKKSTVTEHSRVVEQTKSERAILESVNRHPFVVKLYYAFQDHQKLYLIIEYAQGGELFHHLELERMFSEEVASFYMAEMILALDYLHRNIGVVYRDLKPENCLLDAQGHLLLTDFGLSKIVREDPLADGTETSSNASSRCSSMLGTVDYMAPEVIRGIPYDASVDYWSLGALGFDLLTGAPPFASNNHKKTQQKIVHGKPTMPFFLSPDAKDILIRLMRKEPRKRLGGNMPKDMVTLRNHRFFRRLDWQKLEKRELPAPIQPIITDPAEAENFSHDFTELAMSPVENGVLADENDDGLVGSNPFGGFTYVGSRSLLEQGMF